jgi:LacI family repressor for deo operon, udp, cdd, tsx, nupC, and nupG
VAELLVKNGHTNIGFLGLDAADQMPRFFAEELQRLGIRLEDRNVMIEGHDAENGAEGLRKMMGQTAPPTAIFARTDVLALGAIGEAKAMGIEVPRDLSVVGHDDLPLVSLMQPSLTTLRRDRMHIATAAVDTLFQLMEAPGAMVDERLIDSKLVLRQSVGPVK